MIDKKLVKKRFSRNLKTYKDNSIVQSKMADRLVGMINCQPEKILELGCGSGLLTEKLVREFSAKDYCAIDIVEECRNYIGKISPDIRFYHSDIETYEFQEKYDLIISNAVFQWFKNLDKIIEKCSGMLECDGVLAFSTFSPDNLREFREVSGLSLEYKSVDYIKNILEKDFEIISIESFDYQLKFDNPLKILAHMKNTGVNSLTDKSWSVKDVKIFCDNYNRMFPELTLTYSPIIIVCKKKQ